MMLTYLERYEVIHSFALMATDNQGSTIVMEPGDKFTAVFMDNSNTTLLAIYLTAVEGLSGYHPGDWHIKAVVDGETVAEHVKEVK